MPNNPHRSNLTARLADSQELYARKVALGLERLHTLQDTYDAVDIVTYSHGDSAMHHIRAIQSRRRAILGV